MTRRVTRTPGRTNVTLAEFLAGIEAARKRRAAFAEMSRPRRKEAKRAKPEAKPKPGRAWRRLDEATRQAAIEAMQTHLDSGVGMVEATGRVASKYGMGESTVRKLYYEARYAARVREATP